MVLGANMTGCRPKQADYNYVTFDILSNDISLQDVSGGCFDETITAKLKDWERISQVSKLVKTDAR